MSDELFPDATSSSNHIFTSTSQMGKAYVTGLQTGKRRNASDTAIARMAATCKHFAAFGSPQGGLCVLRLFLKKMSLIYLIGI